MVVHSLLALLRAEGARLGVDSNRLGVLACSGNAPVAIAAVAAGGLQCAVLLYAFTLDGADSSIVGTADALRKNLPITVINHATAPHAFDLIDETRESHDVIRRVLEFARSRLAGDHASL